MKSEFLLFEEIKEEIKPIGIDGSIHDYVSPNGNVYKYIESKDKYLKRK